MAVMYADLENPEPLTAYMVSHGLCLPTNKLTYATPDSILAWRYARRYTAIFRRPADRVWRRPWWTCGMPCPTRPVRPDRGRGNSLGRWFQFHTRAPGKRLFEELAAQDEEAYFAHMRLHAANEEF